MGFPYRTITVNRHKRHAQDHVGRTFEFLDNDRPQEDKDTFRESRKTDNKLFTRSRQQMFPRHSGKRHKLKLAVHQKT